MNFDSIAFISCFLPLLAVLNRLLRSTRARNILLLLGGLLFYAFCGPGAVPVLLCASFVNYLFGLLLLRSGAGKGKGWVAAAVSLNLLLLIAYKYAGFFLAALPSDTWRGHSPAAPVGISFFTFKGISYVIDTCRDRKNGTKHFGRFLLYISFFPQIMAGPITRFGGFNAQLDERDCGLDNLTAGLRRFLIGLGKKLLLSGAAGKVADFVFSPDHGAPGATLAWIGAAAYSLQIYLDFSGYSDMSIGLGMMFGFSTPENFNYPYVAASVTEFWRRWHISLSGWFRDYLYFPLGGSRRGEARAAMNKVVVFALCGLWHGPSWTFVLWGLWHGLFSALESFRRVKDFLRKPPVRVLAHVYTLLVVCSGFVMFRADSVAEGVRVLGAMFGVSGESASLLSPLEIVRTLSCWNIVLLLLGVVACTPLLKLGFARFRDSLAAQALSCAGCAALLVFCVAELAAGGFAPFIYLQF